MGTTISSARWVPDYTNQRVYRDTAVSPTTVDVVNDLYSDLQNLFDDAQQMDDSVPMSAQTPTEYSVINQWFIDDESMKYLKGGAIQTVGYTSGANNYIRKIAYDASGAGTMFESDDVGETITGGTTGDTGTILAWDERDGVEQGTVWIRVDDPTAGGDEFDNGSETWTVSNSAANGSFTAVSTTGEDLWANPFTLGTLEANSRIYLYQSATRIGSDTNTGPFSWPAGIGLNVDGQIDVLVKVRESGTLVDDGFVIAFARQGGKLYDHFETDLSAGGRSPVPLATGDDLNDEIGHYNVTWTAGSGATLLVGEVVDLDSDSEVAAVVAAVTNADQATGDFDYYLIRSLTQFVNTNAVTAVTSGKTMTLGTPTNLAPVSDTDITFTFGNFTRDINNGSGLAPYSIDGNPNSKSFARVYRRGKFLTRRGGTADIDAGTQTIVGESYRGSALQIEYSAQAGGAWTEGSVVYDQSTGASGTITADHDDGATGDVILRDVRGTFTATNTLGDAPSSPTVTATIDSTRTITTPKTAPLGTFAGGTYFGAPGLAFILANIASGEENSYQLTDDDGNQQVPPQQVSVAVTGLQIGDRVAVFRLTGAGGTIVKNEYTSAATGNNAGDTTLDVQTTITSEAPANDQWVRVEYDPDLEDRYHYASYTGSSWTLTSDASWTGRTVSTGDTAGLTLTDSGATFVTSGVLPGMMVRNVTDGSVGVVDSITSETELVLEARLSGGTENDFDVSDAYEINRLVRAYNGSDTVYVPFLDEKRTSAGTSSSTIVYGADIDVLVRVRQGGVILPFEAPNTITNTGMSQAAIRTTDTIAT